MNTFLTLEWAHNYGLSLQEARRPTAEELANYSDEYKPLIMYGVGEQINLPHVTWQDLPQRSSDGCFAGCDNQAYIITKAEWDAYVKLNDDRGAAQLRREREDRIAELREQIAACERQGKLYTAEEAKQRAKNWINTVNEGGEGYVPMYHTKDEYERLRKELQELEVLE